MKKGPAPGSNERIVRARKIAANPHAYKICEGCDSIVVATAVMCPNCHSYRFDDHAERVIEQALIIGGRAQRSVTAEDLG
jgi:RNA polymerase subunit RPABC4/transcription elongation factor Spt4